jgi:circadian clock protein KaiB
MDMPVAMTFEFQLFVARDTQNSMEALSNLTLLCHAHLPGRHKIEVIDVTVDPERAMAANIRMTPTLLKIYPLPAQRIIGTLQQTGRVLLALGLDPGAV